MRVAGAADGIALRQIGEELRRSHGDELRRRAGARVHRDHNLAAAVLAATATQPRTHESVGGGGWMHDGTDGSPYPTGVRRTADGTGLHGGPPLLSAVCARMV